MEDPSSGAAPVLNIRDVTRILWSRKWIIALAIVVSATTAFGFSIRQPDRFQTSARLILKPTTSETLFSSAQRVDEVRALNDEAGLIVSRVVKQAVADDLGQGTDLSSVRASVVSDESSFVSLSASASTPEEAARIVNGYAEAYIEWRRQSRIEDLLEAGTQLQQRIDALDDEIALTSAPITEIDEEIAATASPNERDRLVQERAALNDRLEGQLAPLESQRSFYRQQLDQLQLSVNLTTTGGVQLVSPAGVPGSPTSPRPIRDTALGLVMGLVAGVALALLLEQFDESIRTSADLDAIVPGTPLLGRIPELGDAATTDLDARGVAAEAFRTLRTSVRFAGVDRDLNLIQITSAVPGEGKTSVVANLGVVMAQVSSRVLLIDADLRHPKLHERLGLSNEVGLSSILVGEASFGDAVQVVPGHPNLYLLASGPLPPNPSELLAGARTRALMTSIADECEVALIDSPPVLPVTDAQILSGLADMTVVVARSGVSKRRQLGETMQRLGDVEASIMGIVLNGVRQDDEGIDSYRTRYGYVARPASV